MLAACSDCQWPVAGGLFDAIFGCVLCAAAGVIDPLGVMPLLRRGVKNVIACVATRTDPMVSLQEFAEGAPTA